MLPVFDSLRGTDYISLLFRLFLAVLCGALIGMERSRINRPAGLRTHILVCLGASIAAATGNYIYLGLHLPADVTRMSSQVISGLGFIGAGTILVTRNSTIKGLSTAAGLWTAGIIGLALGSGYYEGGLLATALLLITQLLLVRLEPRISGQMKLSILLRSREKAALDAAMRTLEDHHVTIRQMQVKAEREGSVYEAALLLRSRLDLEAVLELLNAVPGVISAEECPGDHIWSD